MKKASVIIVFFLFSIPVFSQTDTLIKKLDSLSLQTDSAGKQQVNNTKEAAYNELTKLNLKTYFILIGSDLKQDFTKPFHMKKSEWWKLGIFALSAVAVGTRDEAIQKSALKLRNKNSGIANIGKYISSVGGADEMFTLAAIGSYGWIFRKEKLINTTLLASQAYITGTILETVIKLLTGRTRPSFYDKYIEAEPKFKGPFQTRNSSFPSGHATVAFAAATVFSMEYKKNLWVPIVAYSAASLISLSRITENKHWSTDVLVGSMLGYLCGRQIVNNYHRYAKIKAPGMPKNTVGFQMQYNYDHYEPGITYSFR